MVKFWCVPYFLLYSFHKLWIILGIYCQNYSVTDDKIYLFVSPSRLEAILVNNRIWLTYVDDFFAIFDTKKSHFHDFILLLKFPFIKFTWNRTPAISWCPSYQKFYQQAGVWYIQEIYSYDRYIFKAHIIVDNTTSFVWTFQKFGRQ